MLDPNVITEVVEETTETTEKALEGWDKFADWAGGNGNAALLVVGIVVAACIAIPLIVKFCKRIFKK